MTVAAVCGLVHHSTILEMNVGSFCRRWSTRLKLATKGCFACKQGVDGGEKKFKKTKVLYDLASKSS
jgi:hypothetical protein